ncbi:MAG: response regulator receiver modulated metal dependent phosphohydrolase [Enterovirga sp.]|jgi:putative two-component system response regulator|nr:response regulator receiver modulated metal dependent phosphohydrolase [Enterovirga sp.]
MQVLVLDDIELNNVLMVEALRGLPDCRPVAFTSPEEALAHLRDKAAEIGLAITDFDMPRLNGIGFIRAARAIPGFEHVPIIMVTANDQRTLRREALEAGATDFISRPFDPFEIRARAGNLLALNTARLAESDRAAWLDREVRKAVAVIEAREQDLVERLVRAVEHRDTDTGEHVWRVATYARLMAERLGCGAEWCRQLALASTMHDIGKIAVPDAILLKEGPLTPEERTIISLHAERGYDILKGSSSDLVQLAAEIAASHHERWDGHGYPKGLAGTQIPLGGRIVGVADVFDALTTARPYKRAWPVEDARKYLVENAGTQFDPACVEAFMAAWPEVLRIMGGQFGAAQAA